MNEAVVIPAHNEGKHIAEIVRQAKQFLPTIIVVDDGSSDDTAEQAQAARATVLKHKVNLGKGAALKTGCDYALQQGICKLIVMDADGQHPPQDLPRFLTALDQHDIVFGSRAIPTTMPFVFQFGNKTINKTLKILYGLDLQDSQCGYRAFTADAYRSLRWNAQDYYVETEMIINAGKKKLRYTQVPIPTIYSDKYKGTTILDGVMIVAKMIGWRLLK